MAVGCELFFRLGIGEFIAGRSMYGPIVGQVFVISDNFFGNIVAAHNAHVVRHDIGDQAHPMPVQFIHKALIIRFRTDFET
jgi:hypothetical protein